VLHSPPISFFFYGYQNKQQFSLNYKIQNIFYKKNSQNKFLYNSNTDFQQTADETNARPLLFLIRTS
jgi:hypothetical protein